MATLPERAKVVIIGAGIAGNSLVHHLAELGWTDMVQIDKGPLPNPGGSTGHASNFIFLVDHNRENSEITHDSLRQYKEMDVFTRSGGFEVARTQERMEELRRRMSSAKAWGVDASLVSPEEVQEKVPFLDKDVIIGGMWQEGVGVVDSLRAGTIMREKAIAKGALTTVPNVEVLSMVVEEGRIKALETTAGRIEAEHVVIATGIWSYDLARMAGAEIPLTPAVHQMISVGPLPELAEKPGEISFPIIRDMDTLCYERQHGSDMEVGSYPPRCPSPRTTSTRSSSRPSSSCPSCSARTEPRSATPSTVCSPSRSTATPSSARPPRSRDCGPAPPCGSRKAPAPAGPSLR